MDEALERYQKKIWQGIVSDKLKYRMMQEKTLLKNPLVVNILTLKLPRSH